MTVEKTSLAWKVCVCYTFTRSFLWKRKHAKYADTHTTLKKEIQKTVLHQELPLTSYLTSGSVLSVTAQNHILLRKTSVEWFEDESFWLTYAPIMFDEQHWAEAQGIAEACLALADLPPQSRVLDACCALGRVSVELAKCGMDVTGVDITQPYLDAAKESAEAEGLALTLINHDMRTFKSKQKFDAAINVYNSFGYCSSVNDDMKIVKSIARALKKGGTFILECISRETAIRYFTEGEWFKRAGKTVLTQFTVDGAWEGLRSKWILIDDTDGTRTEHEFVQRLYSAAQLRDLLLQNGFKEASVYGGFNKENYDYNAKTMVIVARK